jgi:hypothetical protein
MKTIEAKQINLSPHAQTNSIVTQGVLPSGGAVLTG